MLRQPIVAVMGHVDHGKTSILDKIRGSGIAAREAGGITQAIGASIIPLPTIQQICGDLLAKLKFNITIPGLLFIDTPGHAAFTNLRRRGGNLADIAILVVDINEGVMPQTKESIEILKKYRTPFIVACNKVDMVEGWRSDRGPVVPNIARQSEETTRRFETKLYNIVSQVFELGINADRFDRVSDYTKQVALVPVSAKTGEGVAEVLMVLAALAQKYLEESLKATDGPAKGTILEVKEQKGLGTVLDVIIYDGKLKVGDQIVVATQNGIIEAKVKTMLEPSGMAEMREKKAQFVQVREVRAATGVRVVAPGTEGAASGMPLLGVGANVEEAQEQLRKEVGEVLIETDSDGIIIKADSLGSLEALMVLLKEAGIPVRKSSIGPITKKDVSDAEALRAKDPLHGIIVGFNISKPDFQTNVPVIVSDVIYRLIEQYAEWKESQKKNIELAKLDVLVRPCKIELLKGYVFRQNNPAIVGVEVLAGLLKSGCPLMNKQGQTLTQVKGIQLEQENVDRAEKGKRVAASLPDVTVGRQVQEGDILYSAIPEEHFREYKAYKDHLTDDEKNVLKEIAEIMRVKNAVWGI